MKAETLNKNKFKPIEMKITIESEEELMKLWVVLDCFDKHHEFLKEVDKHIERLKLKD